MRPPATGPAPSTQRQGLLVGGLLVGGLLAGAFLASACTREEQPAPAPAASAVAGAQRVQVRVTAKGYEPAVVHLKQGQPAFLEFTREVDSECLNAVRMPWMNTPLPLPKGETVAIAVDTREARTFSYSCWMTMVFGRVVIEP